MAKAQEQSMKPDLAAIVSERPEFTVDEALRIADQNAETYDKVASVSRTLAAEVRRLHSQANEREGWRPIETAPKDGSLFLCWVDAVRYGERDDGSFDTADCSDVDFCQWRDSEYGGYFMNMMGEIGDGQNITHWMPLPAAPTGGSET